MSLSKCITHQKDIKKAILIQEINELNKRLLQYDGLSKRVNKLISLNQPKLDSLFEQLNPYNRSELKSECETANENMKKLLIERKTIKKEIAIATEKLNFLTAQMHNA
jgi:ABC-type phosphate transport system auxiliary subunit